MPVLNIGARRLMLIVCIFPASFMAYPHPSHWFHALKGGKSFFINIMEDADELIEQLNGRSWLWRFCAGYPLRFARQIIWRGGVRKAFQHCWSQFHSPTKNTIPFLKPPKPSVIELIPGLVEGHPSACEQCRHFLYNFPTEKISIKEYGHILFGKEHNFAGTTSVVVAHWDAQQQIDPYVQYMCRSFKSQGWHVVLASADPLNASNDLLESKPDWVDAIVYRTCPGYDFTSWKCALSCLPSLYSAHELVLCNDSVFGGIGSYEKMHNRMDEVNCDFWGISESREQCPHLQSYYLVFRQRVLSNNAFKSFFDVLPLSSSRKTAILGETSFSLWLALHGLRPAALVPFDERLEPSINPSCEEWRLLMEAGAPIFKRELLQKNERQIPLAGWCDFLSARGYPLQLIFNYFKRIGVALSLNQCYEAPNKTWPPSVCALEQSITLNEFTPSKKKRPRIGVFFHIFYTEVAPEMLDCMDNLPSNAFVHVSTDTIAKQTALTKLFAQRGYADRSEIRVFPNKGWDIAPFLVGYGPEIERYPLILRMHSKRSSHISGDTGEQWRKMLYGTLAGSSERVNAIINEFEKDPKLGMICPPLLSHYAHCVHFGGNFSYMHDLLMERGILISSDQRIDFPMGSMFWCRPQALSTWLHPYFTFDDFVPSADKDSERDGTLAHALERLFFFGCGLAGLTWARIPAFSDHQFRQ